MHITLRSVLNHDIFSGAKILAGQEGLSRTIARVSVFDCPISDDIIDKKIIDRGDFFLSGLEQFRSCPEKIKDFVRILDSVPGSGLCIDEANCELFPGSALRYCDEHDFPVIALDWDISYASIMDVINKLVIMSHLHLLNELKIDKLLYNKLTDLEKMEILDSINPHVDTFTQILAVDNGISLARSEHDLNLYFLDRKSDIYIRYKSQELILLSHNTAKQLAQKRSATVAYLQQIYPACTIGAGQVHPRRNFDQGLPEARLSLDSARRAEARYLEYDSRSPLHFLISLRHSKELNDYFQAIIAPLQQYDPDGKLELIRTMKEYVRSGGDYAKAALQVGQHENTIRYRVNRIRTIWGMEEDLLRFHETLSLAAKLDDILGQ